VCWCDGVREECFEVVRGRHSRGDCWGCEGMTFHFRSFVGHTLSFVRSFFFSALAFTTRGGYHVDFCFTFVLRTLLFPVRWTFCWTVSFVQLLLIKSPWSSSYSVNQHDILHLSSGTAILSQRAIDRPSAIGKRPPTESGIHREPVLRLEPSSPRRNGERGVETSETHRA